MHYLDWARSSRFVLASLLAMAGACSDDGLTSAGSGSPAGTTGTNDGNDVATSSVNTSATVTASGSGDDTDEGEGKLDVPPVGDSTGGFDESGGTEGRDTGRDTDDSGDDDGGSSTGGTPPPEPECVAGEECNCDPDQVLCDLPPPECPPDLVPLVFEGCWDGACVPIESCFDVFDCEMCDEDEACVAATDLGGQHLTCQEIDPGCVDMVPTCECMPMACEAPFFVCSPTPVGSGHDLSCVCPTC